jgi:hypothetical protein
LIKVTDNFLDDDSFEAVGKTSMVYSKVHWVGRHALPENPLHDLVYKVFCHEWPDGHGSIKGATAWWNIRPIDPKPHSDLISYCTSGGVDYTPDDPPERTFIYYLRAPDKGGHLNIYTKPPVNIPNPAYDYPIFRWNDYEVDSIAPIPNRLISFPIECTHAVQSYEGNRVSIGMIFWNELPSIYKSPNDFGGQTNQNYNTSFDRPWEKTENQESNRKLTEEHIMGHPV